MKTLFPVIDREEGSRNVLKGSHSLSEPGRLDCRVLPLDST